MGPITYCLHVGGLLIQTGGLSPFPSYLGDALDALQSVLAPFRVLRIRRDFRPGYSFVSFLCWGFVSFLLNLSRLFF